MNIYIILGAIIGVSANLPLIIGISKNRIKQSFSTWILWALLDIIAGTSTILRDGNWLLPTLYALSSTLITLLLLYKGQFTWSSFDTFVTVLVILCVVVWALAGSHWAIIASTSAVVIASFPQFIEVWKNPKTYPLIVLFGYAIGNFLSVMGGKNWSIEERLYPVAVTAFTTIWLLCSLRPSPQNKTVSL